MKRIAVYVYYDKNNELADYAQFFLNSLLDVVDKILVVINGKVNEDELKKINNPKIKIFQRENDGYDFWAYREGYYKIKEELENYDELVLCNSSVYGPIYPFFEMFSKMSEKNLDFWGITLHPEIDYNIIPYNPKTKIKEHIQSYFIVFNKKMFSTEEFQNYFLNMKKPKNKKEAIGYLEIGLTQYFKRLGFKYDTYIPYDKTFCVDNIIQYEPDILVQKYRCPLIKKTIFGYRYDLAQRENTGNRTKKLFNFLCSLDFDTSLIIKDISKNYSMSEIKSFLHLHYPVSDTKREHFEMAKFAVVTDIKDIITPYFDEYKNYADIFAITEGKNKKQTSFLDYASQIRELTKKYEYILFIMPDREIFSLKKSVSNNYIHYIFDSLVLNPIYVSNVVNLFKKYPYLGIITAKPFIFPDFKPEHYSIKENDVKSIIQKYEILHPYSMEFISTLSGCFWIKSSIFNLVSDVLDYSFKSKLNMGMIFSLIVQKYGYLTGTVSSYENLVNYADNLEYSILNKNRRLKRILKRFSIGL